jgi:hypothetical protein
MEWGYCCKQKWVTNDGPIKEAHCNPKRKTTKQNKKSPFDLMHYTTINRTNNSYGQQYGFSIPSMVPILTQ